MNRLEFHGEFGFFRLTILRPCLSGYEMKNDCCTFERLYKMKKNGVFRFGISFLVLEILTFLYYANEESDDVMSSFTKTVKH